MAGSFKKIEGPTLKGRVFWEMVKGKQNRGRKQKERERKEIKLKPIRIHEDQ